MNWIYLAFEVSSSDLSAAVKGGRALGIRGFNLTHPHKQAVIAMLDRLSPEAEAIGAVNTVAFRNGEAIGYNTDAAGFSSFLGEEGFDFRDGNVVVIGAGGAGRAVAWAAAREGARLVSAYDLEAEKARSLCRDFGPLFASAVFRPLDDPDELREALSAAGLVINATPMGMADSDPAVVDVGLLPRAAWFVDLVYKPAETSSLKEARESGREGRNGLGMLVYQAAAAWEIWTGRPAPLNEMASAAELVLSGGRD